MALLQDLVEEGSEIILILDDYHVISDQAIDDTMLFLIDHVPANLHLVLATRTDPELPLSRFRVRSQLIEIRDRDLRFTQEEAASFLTRGMGLPLSGAMVASGGEPGAGVGMGSADNAFLGGMEPFAQRGGANAGACLFGTAAVRSGDRDAGTLQSAP